MPFQLYALHTLLGKVVQPWLGFATKNTKVTKNQARNFLCLSCFSWLVS